MKSGTVLAMAAHPDDIEFMMAGTLFLLKERSWDIHLWNLAHGDCGTADLGYAEIVAMRWKEAQQAAAYLGATIHPPVADDLCIFYERSLIAKAAALVRMVKPDIVLLPSPQDYMEDHSNTSRIGVTAAFSRGMKNFRTDPAVGPWQGACTLYHALPYGLRDGSGTRVHPECFADVSSVMAKKTDMLAMHKSQKEWLDVSQGAGSYVSRMKSMTREIGQESGSFEYAEGWRKHSCLGFCDERHDPLKDTLGTFLSFKKDSKKTEEKDND